MKRTIRVFSLLLAAVMLLSAQALATEPAQAVTDVEHSGQYLCGLPRVEPAQAFTDVTKQERICTESGLHPRRLCDLPLARRREAGRELRDELF